MPTPAPPSERRGLDRRWVALAATAVAVLLAAAIALAFLLRDGDDDGADTGGGGEISDQLVFAADGRIFTTGADGSDEVDLTRGRRGDAQPDWSPDGERIALARAGDIWVIDASGENARPLTSGGEQDAAPDWSPDGTRIAFDRAKRRAGNGTHDVWVMSADGARQSNLTARTGESGAQPDWSPDGTQILFQRKGAMWTMRTDGSAQRRLPLALPGSVHEPVWSPDGTEIAFALASAGTSDIHVYVVGELGRTVRNLTDGRVTRPRFASWSSDGEQIVFAAEDGIWTIGRDGGGLTRLTQGKNLTAPSWRPRQG